jgi:dTDP-4-amino-4,6-dideoxygalactose transaminase
MNIPFGMPIIGDEEKLAVMKVLEGSILVHGPLATKFEDDFCNFTSAPYAVSVSSCTAGMHLVYFALGYGPGDEVIIPAQTHVATAHAVELTGARAVFVDAELATGNIDIAAIEAAITSKTLAIAVVHYLGVPVDMPKITDIAKKYSLFVLEDCALAPGAKVNNVHVGLHGDVGVFSFYPVKHFTTAEGGIIVLKDENFAKRLRLLKAFGVDRSHSERKEPGVYDTVALGFNYRMSEIHAAIGIEQIKKLPIFLEKRRQNYELLEKSIIGIKGLRLLPQPFNKHLQSCHYCAGVILEEHLMSKRGEIMTKLGQKGIGTSVYYPQPVPRMTYYKNRYGYEGSNYPNATKISDGIIALTVAPHVTSDQVTYMANELKAIMKDLNG